MFSAVSDKFAYMTSCRADIVADMRNCCTMHFTMFN